MNDTRPMIDQQERTRALDPAHSFIVRAPAGSGKTELLVQRILKLLCTVEQPEAIVAITFTRKAAAEMRQRVVAALENPASSKAPELAQAARDHDVAQKWSLMSNPARLRIQTIDSLCLELASRMPWMSRMGAPFEPIEDANEFYTEAARRTVLLLEHDDALGNAVRSLLRNRDNNVGNVEAMLAQMLAKRDQWLPLTGTGNYSTQHKLDLRQRMGSALQSMISSALKQVWDLFPRNFSEEFCALADHAGRTIENEKSTIDLCSGMHDLPSAKADRADQWKAIHELLLTGEGQWRKTVNKNQGFPSGDALKDRMVQLLLQLAEGKYEPFRQALADLKFLPNPRYEDSQWNLILDLLLVLPATAAQLRALFAERGAMDFIETSLAALRSLRDENGHPTDLGMAFGHRIQHLLVDEFQDTSHSQIELLRALTATWDPGDGSTLFLVGDPMQSIYRFRKAEVGLFLEAQKSGIGDAGRPFPLEQIVLHQNFRSQQGVVDWVNGSFARIFTGHNDPERGAVAFERSEAFKKKDEDIVPPAAFHPFFSADSHEYRKQEAGKIVDLIQRSQAADRKDIAILVRARTHLAEILPALRRAGIAYQAIDVDSLDQRQCVLDLLALTRALLRPADRIAWLSILRAPWCGLENSDLHALCGDSAGHHTTVLQLMQQNIAALSSDARSRVERIHKIMFTALEQRQRLPLHTWVESVWRQLGGDATLDLSPGSNDEQDTNTFFHLLETVSTTGDFEITATLAARLKKLRAAPENADAAVRIMTIHNAKGLEFDVVIVPGLGSRPPNEDPPLLRWSEHTSLVGGAVFASIEEQGEEKDPHSRFLAWMEKQRTRNEAKRLLYVAATRVRSQLHLLANIKPKEKDGEVILEPAAGSLLAHLWPAVEDMMTPPAQHPAPNSDPVSPDPASPEVKKLRRLPAEFSPSLLPNDVIFSLDRSEDDEPREKPTFDWAQETAKIIGTVVHAFLCRITNEGAARWDRARITQNHHALRVALQSAGLFGDELDRAVPRASSALVSALTSQRGSWILAPHNDAASELELTAHLNGETVHKKIDRTFVEDGVRWIIDYKVGFQESQSEKELMSFREREKDKYREQLADYARIMRLKNPRPIRTALYYPLMDEFLEVEL